MFENTIISRIHFTSEDSEDSVCSHVLIDSEVKSNCNLEADRRRYYLYTAGMRRRKLFRSSHVLLYNIQSTSGHRFALQLHQQSTIVASPTTESTFKIGPSFCPLTGSTAQNRQRLTYQMLAASPGPMCQTTKRQQVGSGGVPSTPLRAWDRKSFSVQKNINERTYAS